jgi:NTP pyrophosphatase (non-canonical NTP hydrolase)
MDIYEKLGHAAIYEQLAEECTELAQAALKLARIERGENPTPKTRQEAWGDFLEEWADAKICLALISYTPEDYGEVLRIGREKLQRWKQRLEEQEERKKL